MRCFLAILFLFAGFALLLLGAFFVLTWLIPLNSKPLSAPSWPVAVIGLCLMFAGWFLRRIGLSRWRAAATSR